MEGEPFIGSFLVGNIQAIAEDDVIRVERLRRNWDQFRLTKGRLQPGQALLRRQPVDGRIGRNHQCLRGLRDVDLIHQGGSIEHGRGADETAIYLQTAGQFFDHLVGQTIPDDADTRAADGRQALIEVIIIILIVCRGGLGGSWLSRAGRQRHELYPLEIHDRSDVIALSDQLFAEIHVDGIGLGRQLECRALRVDLHDIEFGGVDPEHAPVDRTAGPGGGVKSAVGRQIGGSG